METTIALTSDKHAAADAQSASATTALEEGTSSGMVPSQSRDDHDENSDSADDVDDDTQRNVSRRWPWCRHSPAIAGMVVILGAVATAAFSTLGITAAVSKEDETFVQDARSLVQQIEIAMKDYEVAALWIHQACTSDNITHVEFRELYEQILSTGIDTQIEFLPRVTHEDRPRYEQEMKEFLAEYYPYVDYPGFVGLEPNPETGELELLPRSEQDVYWPIHFIEPIPGSEPALDFDGYSRAGLKLTIDQVMLNYEPAFSEPVHLVEETEENALAVFFIHPGVPVSTRPNMKAKDLALLVVRIPDLMARATATHSRSTETYLYDTTGGKELFVGGIRWIVSDNDHKEYTLFPYQSLAEVERQSRLCEKQIVKIADREWTIAVVAVQGTYEADIAFVITGAVLLFICSVCMAAWVYSMLRYASMRRKAKLSEVTTSLEREKADLILENANKAAKAERTLNDFIAHEVRNPVAAAISACSFVKTTLSEGPLINLSSRQTVREDVEIIDNSLNFINDLLRSMLDLHRASTNQLKIENRYTCIYNDILKPVDSMLYRRGSDIKVIIDCDPSLVVETDCLRLKQVSTHSPFLCSGRANSIDYQILTVSTVPHRLC